MATEILKRQIRKLGAAARGYVGILSTLEGEHAEVAALIDQVLDADDIDDRLELYCRLRIKLLAHAEAEESEFYPICREYAETHALVSDAVDDHQHIVRYLAELTLLDPLVPAWLETFLHLKQQIEQHVTREESVLLERCKEVISKERLRALDRNYKARRELIEQSIEDQSRGTRFGIGSDVHPVL